MNDSQIGFSFDAPLTTNPVSQIRPKPKPEPRTQEADQSLVDRFAVVIPGLPDDLCLDDLLIAAGMDKVSIVGWHRSRAMDALLGVPLGTGDYQAFTAANGKLRFRRKVPFELCRGRWSMAASAVHVGG